MLRAYIDAPDAPAPSAESTLTLPPPPTRRQADMATLRPVYTDLLRQRAVLTSPDLQQRLAQVGAWPNMDWERWDRDVAEYQQARRDELVRN